MRAVVLGGAGFLGSHLADALVARGDEVVCVDDLSSGTPANLERHEGDDAVELIVADACEPLQVSGPVDAVLHLASPASPRDYLARPLETMAAGTDATRRGLELAARHGARFLLASTSEVYGDPLVHPQRETYWGNVNPVGARSVYDEAKRYAEALTAAWHRTYEADVAVVRIFNTYGPRLRAGDGRVVSNFVVQALAGKPLTIYGDGTQTRSFCYVSDMVKGLLAVLDSSVRGPVNLGNPTETTILELAETVIELAGSPSSIEKAPLPEDDPGRRCPDITLARSELGWEPTVPLRDGLEQTARWFRAYLGGGASGS